MNDCRRGMAETLLAGSYGFAGSSVDVCLESSAVEGEFSTRVDHRLFKCPARSDADFETKLEC